MDGELLQTLRISWGNSPESGWWRAILIIYSSKLVPIAWITIGFMCDSIFSWGAIPNYNLGGHCTCETPAKSMTLIPSLATGFARTFIASQQVTFGNQEWNM